MPRKSKSPYEVLGVDKAANPAQVKRAYRKKASQAHPDKGGNHDEMAEINHAFDVLSDPARKQLYDATGQDSRKPIEDEARAVLMEAFGDALSKDADNCLKHAKQFITNRKGQLQTNKAMALDADKRLTKRRDKISVKSGENVFHQLIDAELHRIAQGIAQLDHAIEVMNLALKMLADYKSTEEAVQTMTVTMDFGTYRISADTAGW